MVRVIVTGSESQLAKTIKKNSNKARDKFIFYNKKELNIKNKSKIKKIIAKVKPEYIINTAALTNLEQIEKNINEAIKINGEAPFYLAQLAKKYNFTLIHISTDYVFDGKKRSYYKISDKQNPINNYGLSKYLAEKKILSKLNSNSIIIRVSWLYSNYKKNFYSVILSKILNSENLSMVSDMYSHPTSTNNLSNFLMHLISKKVNAKKNIEILHFRDYGKPISPFQFSKYILKILSNKKNFENKILPIPYCKYKTNVVRPYYSAMNIRRTISNHNFKPNSWKDEILNLILEKNQ